MDAVRRRFKDLQASSLEGPNQIAAGLLIVWFAGRTLDLGRVIDLWALGATATVLLWPGAGIALLGTTFYPPLHTGDTGVLITMAMLFGLLLRGGLAKEWLTGRRIAALAAVLALAVIAGLLRTVARFGPEIEGPGVIRAVGLLAGLALVWALPQIARSGVRRSFAIGLVLAVGAILVALVESVAPGWLNASPLAWLTRETASHRATGTFSSPNQLGTVAGVILVAALGGLWSNRRWTPALILAGLVAALGLIASFSRGALLGVVVAMTVLIGRRSRIGAVAFVVVVVVVAALVGPAFMDTRLGGGVGSDLPAAQAENDAGRIDAWVAGLRMFAHSPLVGNGIGSFRELGPAFGGPDNLFTAHNDTIALLAEAGFVAGAAFVAMMALVLLELWRRRGWLSAVGLGVTLVLLVAGSFNAQFQYLPISFAAISLAALGLAEPEPAAGQRFSQRTVSGTHRRPPEDAPTTLDP